MAKEYIEREALIEEIRSLQVTVTGLRSGKGVLNQYARFYRDSVERAIVEAPTADVVEVVRCKDCRMYVDNKEAFVKYCRRGLRDIPVMPDDYCSRGERKEK